MTQKSKTKIICTIGPASADLQTLNDMFLSGMSIVRLNLSHGNRLNHSSVIQNVRKLESKYRNKIFIALDTRGPELRIKCPAPLHIKPNDPVRLFSSSHPDNINGIAVNLASFDGVVLGSKISLDDSKLQLEVTHLTTTCVETKALNSHVLENNKRIHFDSLTTGYPFINEEDKADILFGIENSIDMIFASFVQSATDVAEIRNIVSDPTVQIISKIESKKAVENINEIADVSDGIMIARGDLMNDVGVDALYSCQKQLVKLSNKIPVIMATEMLQSMVNNRNPSRAEVSDVGNAVADGCTAVMLSSETSIGKFPVRCVEVARTVAVDAERHLGLSEDQNVMNEWTSNSNRSSILARGVYFKK